MKKLLFNEKEIYIEEFGTSGPILYWPTEIFYSGEIEYFIELLKEENLSFLLVAIQIQDWNKELSPWSSCFNGMNFVGNGKDLNYYMRELLIPYIYKEYGKRKSYLIGYSLAGLYALWNAYLENDYDGIACCSGSLWYEGWMEFAEKHEINHPTILYLSLGSKEANSKNPVLATIDDCMKEQVTLLKKDKNVANIKYELNSGGHFADGEKRLLKAVKWLSQVEMKK